MKIHEYITATGVTLVWIARAAGIPYHRMVTYKRGGAVPAAAARAIVAATKGGVRLRDLRGALPGTSQLAGSGGGSGESCRPAGKTPGIVDAGSSGCNPGPARLARG